ncbi:MAG: trehalose-6-phosphate synthase, partial [Chloroflexota bacterium]
MTIEPTGRSDERPVVPIDRRARLAEHLRALVGDDERLVVVSNRGPLSFKRTRAGDWKVQRGSGGLVTALAEVGRLAPITWISAAMDAADREASGALRADTGEAHLQLLRRIEEQMPGQDLKLDLREVPSAAWQAHYGKIANPFLWFMQHQLYTLAYEPTVDEELIDAWQNGYRVVNEAFAAAVLEQTKDYRRPVVLLQDYHLYLAASTIRAKRPDSLLLHFNH